jgi:hypothetical protein
VLHVLKTQSLALEVWHHAPRSLREEGTNSWLGTVSVPLSQLVKSKSGEFCGLFCRLKEAIAKF